MAVLRKRTRRTFGKLVTWLIVVGAAFGIVSYRLVDKLGMEKRPVDRFHVVKVLDGDTVELTGGDKVRLLSLDTPEHGEPFFEQARQMLQKLALGKSVRLEQPQARRDKYGRMLGYVYVDDTLMANRMLIDSGLGYLYLFQDNDLNSPHVRDMLQAQRSAIARKVGLWSIQRHAEDHYVTTARSLRLHRPSCEAVKNLGPGKGRIFATREEGLAEGLSPCRECKP
jgi:micrococcal nuclease